MNAALVVFGCIILLIIGYRFYSRFLSHKIFSLDTEQRPTPAYVLQDDIDYIPTQKQVLFGHHFSSIAGAAPIVGPAVAIIWGWVPAILWIVIGVVFMGAAHDLAALVLSMKNQGKSLGAIAENLLGKWGKISFLIVIFFLIWMVLAVFSLIIANLFIDYPSSVLPVNFQILIAIILGVIINKKKKSLKLPSIIAQILLLAFIVLGTYLPLSLPSFLSMPPIILWIILLMLYSFIASTLPVWLLLQPRDYINSHQLFLGLALILIGLLIGQPRIVAPAFNFNATGAPHWFPFLFITIACGAISGFHGLVSSGTTSKQIKNWKDARLIGYGGMLGEGLLAILATLAVSAGFESELAWHNHYASWDQANGLAEKISAFVNGSSQFIAHLGIPQNFSHTLISVLIISFAATSLDTAARIQRYIVSEIATHFHLDRISSRYPASLITIGSACWLALHRSDGTGGLLLWPLFGATNQMLAFLVLVLTTLYVQKEAKNKYYHLVYFIPALFIFFITSYSLIINVYSFYVSKNLFLAVLAFTLFSIQLIVMFFSAKKIYFQSL